MIRNFFTALGVASVFAVFFFFIHPDWIKQLSSSPTAIAPGTVTKVSRRLSSDRLLAKQMPTEKGGLLVVEPQPTGEDHTSKIVEDVGEDCRRETPIIFLSSTSRTIRCVIAVWATAFAR